ncbi:Uncharacterised protein [Salmonella enterica subsp. enterica]|nr:Uncharacterised protein [Salmonella enterica subsp. enterica]
MKSENKKTSRKITDFLMHGLISVISGWTFISVSLLVSLFKYMDTKNSLYQYINTDCWVHYMVTIHLFGK